jgi:hypothetical protein
MCLLVPSEEPPNRSTRHKSHIAKVVRAISTVLFSEQASQQVEQVDLAAEAMQKSLKASLK